MGLATQSDQSGKAQQYTELIRDIPTTTPARDLYMYQDFINLKKIPEAITIYLIPYLTYPPLPQEKSMQTIGNEFVYGLFTIIPELVNKLVRRDVIRNMITYNDPDYGPVIRLVVDLDAREALELWLKLAKLFPYSKYGVVIGVRWLGKNNVSRDELADYIFKIMTESSLRTIVLRSFDVVEEMRRERDKR
jgi:hypothetical protein